jgi:serine/threonine protein kinase
MTEDWKRWESQVVNGIYPLRRFLGHSDHSVVFLTEFPAETVPSAIKLIPADPKAAIAQLSYWRVASSLSHPHVVRLFDTGRCQLGGHPFLYVTMEYADEALAELLPRRALSADEARGMLPPILDALAFLHRQQLVHGRLTPANIVVVNDTVKLTSDAIRPAGEVNTTAGRSIFDPPEAEYGRTNPAGDIWALGVTLTRALTQNDPLWRAGLDEPAERPAEVPADLADLIMRCLDPDPARRPSADALQEPWRAGENIPRTATPSTTELLAEALTEEPPAAEDRAASAEPPPQAPVPPPHEPPRNDTTQPIVFWQPPGRGASRRARGAARTPPAWLMVGILVLVVIVITVGLRLLRHPTPSRTDQPVTLPPVASAPAVTPPNTPSPAEVPAVAAPPQHAERAPAGEPSGSGVVHEELPNPSRSARETIRGHIKIAVQVAVDSSGNVVGDSLELAGPSPYFARLATQAARKWKFSRSDDPSPRHWLLRFEFSHDGTTAQATAR